MCHAQAFLQSNFDRCFDQMRGFPKVFKFVFLLACISPAIVLTGCGGNGGEAKMETYEPITEEEQLVVEEKMERLRDEPRGN